MNEVWKFNINDNQVVPMPKGAKPLSVAFQGGVLTVWALVDIDAPHECRRFIMIGTGHTIRIKPELLDFIGTVFTGPLVFHIFEVLDG